MLTFFGVLFVAVMLAGPKQQSDEGSYVRYAERLAHGYYSDPSTPDLWFGPGLPVLLTPFAVIGAPIDVMRLLGPAALLAAIVLFHALLRQHVSRRGALIGALALGLYIPFYVLLPTLHSETVAVFFVVLFMYALTRYVRSEGWALLALSGGALGYLALTRIVFGWIVAFGLVFWLLVWIFHRYSLGLRFALVHLIALVACLPWLAYTYSISGNVFYWGSSGGQSLYWMAAPFKGHLGDWHSREEVFSNPSLAPARAEFEKIRSLDQVEADAVWRHDAVRLIKAHPQRYARHLLENLSRLWFNTPYSFTPQKLSTVLYIVPNALLLVGVVAAAAVLWIRRRLLPRVVAPFVVLMLLGVGVQGLLAAYSRMLVPLVPILVWLIVLAFDRYVQISLGAQPPRLRQPSRS